MTDKNKLTPDAIAELEELSGHKASSYTLQYIKLPLKRPPNTKLRSNGS
nr:hypothetical protein [Pseudomonas fulva]